MCGPARVSVCVYVGRASVRRVPVRPYGWRAVCGSECPVWRLPPPPAGYFSVTIYRIPIKARVLLGYSRSVPIWLGLWISDKVQQKGMIG